MADYTDTFYRIADDAIHGYGAQLMVGDGASPETFQAIAGILSIQPGEISTADIDTTHLRSPNRHREHRAGIRDSGPFTVTGTWLPKDESQSYTGGGSGSFVSGGLAYLAAQGTNHNFKIVLNDGSPATEWPFRAYVASFTPGGIGVDDRITFTATFQPVQDYTADLP